MLCFIETNNVDFWERKTFRPSHCNLLDMAGFRDHSQRVKVNP